MRIGMLPLADAVPLLVARDMGFFAEQGLDVTLSLEGSWAGIRDKLAAGMLDAAQLLAPMPLAANLGADHLGVPMEAAIVLSRNGSSITVSNELFLAMGSPSPDPVAAGQALWRVIEADRVAGRPRRTFAHVFPFSAHHYLLRDWLDAAGIEPDRDINLVVIPPPLMLEHLRSGRVDGYCVSAPWGMAAEIEGVGRRLMPTHLLRTDCADKVIGVTREWAVLNAQSHLSMIAALIEAGHWLEQGDHRKQAAQMLVDSRLIAAPHESLLRALTDEGDGVYAPRFVFGLGDSARPRHEDARWFLSQMRRWDQVNGPIDVDALVESSYRLALHEQARATVQASVYDDATVRPLH
jgi:ABC-type nitrate/sulfonate/bicarbonate transport system substrate-binding protein